MHPTQAEVIVQQHIEDLHREAAKQRRRRGAQKPQPHRRRAAWKRLQRAPAH